MSDLTMRAGYENEGFEEDDRARLLHSWEIVVRMTGVYTR